MNAFMDGAQRSTRTSSSCVTFINSWYDPPKAKEAAFAMIDRGADVMYAERFGVSDAAKERKRQGHRQRHRHRSAISRHRARRARSGTWSRRSTAPSRRCTDGTLRGRGLRPVQLHGARRREPRRSTRSWCRPTWSKLVKEKEKEIKDGMFRVKVNDAEPKSTLIRSEARPTRATGLPRPWSLRRLCRRHHQALRRARRQRRASTSSCGAARSWRCSARTAPARRR